MPKRICFWTEYRIFQIYCDILSYIHDMGTILYTISRDVCWHVRYFVRYVVYLLTDIRYFRYWFDEISHILNIFEIFCQIFCIFVDGLSDISDIASTRYRISSIFYELCRYELTIDVRDRVSDNTTQERDIIDHRHAILIAV